MIRIILIDCGSKCHRICRRSCVKFTTIVAKQGSRLLTNAFQHFCQQTICNGVRETVVGQNVIMTMGTLHIFRKIAFDMQFTCESQYLAKIINFHFLCFIDLLLIEDRDGKLLISITRLLHSEYIYTHCVLAPGPLTQALGLNLFQNHDMGRSTHT
jgi:hypothetical protein